MVYNGGSTKSCTVRFVYRIFECSFVLGIFDSLAFRIFVLGLVSVICCTLFLHLFLCYTFVPVSIFLLGGFHSCSNPIMPCSTCTVLRIVLHVFVGGNKSTSA